MKTTERSGFFLAPKDWANPDALLVFGTGGLGRNRALANERFGTNLTETDQLLFDQFEQDWIAHPTPVAQARQNDLANFRLAFDREFMKSVVARTEGEIERLITADLDPTKGELRERAKRKALERELEERQRQRYAYVEAVMLAVG